MSSTDTAAAPEGGVNYKERLKRFAHGALDPVVGGLARMGVKPDHLTLLGFVLSLAAGLLFSLGRFRWAAIVTCLAGVCDILDGQIARRTQTVTRFGAFFDSTLDRVAEAALLVGLSWFFVFNLVDMAVNPSRVLLNLQNGLEPVTWGVLGLLPMLALVGSFMVSYTRARAEGLGPLGLRDEGRVDLRGHVGARADEDGIAAGRDRKPAPLGQRAGQGPHGNVVTHQQAIKSDRSANHVADHYRRCGRRLDGVDRAEHNMCGHAERQT